MELRIKEIVSLEPDFINEFIYGKLVSGKEFRLKVSIDKIEKVYTELKNKVYDLREKYVEPPKFKDTRRKIDKMYKIYDVEGNKWLTVEELEKEVSKPFDRFYSSWRCYGRYKGKTYEIYKNDKLVELKFRDRSARKYFIFTCDEFENLGEKTSDFWIKLLKIPKGTFWRNVREGKKCNGYRLTCIGKKELKDIE